MFGSVSDSFLSTCVQKSLFALNALVAMSNYSAFAPCGATCKSAASISRNIIMKSSADKSVSLPRLIFKFFGDAAGADEAGD